MILVKFTGVKKVLVLVVSHVLLKYLLLWLGLAVDAISGTVGGGDDHRLGPQEAKTGAEQDGRGDIRIRGAVLGVPLSPSASSCRHPDGTVMELRPVRVHPLPQKLLLLSLHVGGWLDTMLAVAGGQVSLQVRVGSCWTLLGGGASPVCITHVYIHVPPTCEVGVASLRMVGVALLRGVVMFLLLFLFLLW